MKLSLLGIGSLRCGAPIVASLATYFGEQPLEICMYDEDVERLEIYDRLARLCFLTTEAPHRLVSTDDPDEAIADSEFIVLSIGENCARRYLARRGVEPDSEPVAQVIDLIDLGQQPQASILSLQKVPIRLDGYYQVSWPDDLPNDERTFYPLQLLRWLNEEEHLHDLLKQCSKSPLKAWLDNPTTADYVGLG
jgi:hypothetical protein